MADSDKTKVFISWSGDLAKEVAIALRDWLPKLFDVIEPWTSTDDISAGQRGLPQIEQTLVGSRFGIIVVTQQNQHAPWLNFEAGALSKVISTDTEQRVAPLLVDLASAAEVTGPLNQFQSNVLNREGLTRTLVSLGQVINVDEDVVVDRVDTYWPRLEAKVSEAKKTNHSQVVKPLRSERDILEEVLTTVRQLRRDESDPSSGSRPPGRMLDELARKQLARLNDESDAERKARDEWAHSRDTTKGVYNLVQVIADSLDVELLSMRFDDPDGDSATLTIPKDTSNDVITQLFSATKKQFPSMTISIRRK